MSDSSSGSGASTTPISGAVRGGALLGSIHALTVTITGVSIEQLVFTPRPDFERITTLITLEGDVGRGTGEAIHYDADTQRLLPAWFARIAHHLVGTFTLGELSEHLDRLDFPPIIDTPAPTDKPGFARWAIESAALDLALSVAGLDLAALAGAPWAPLRTTPSMGLGDPPSTDVVHGWLQHEPGTEFKLDMNRTWTSELIEDLAATSAVVTIDFKGLYGDVDFIDTTPDPPLFAQIAAGLPDAILEDMNLTDEVRAALDDAALARLSWDFPVTSPQDVPGIAGSTATFSDLRPAAINIKPSRFGSMRRVLETIDLCQQHGIAMYSGGQFELGRGRTQVQEIAAMCFADGPNDCSPVMWHGAKPGDDVPAQPLQISSHVGFGFDAATPAASRTVQD